MLSSVIEFSECLHPSIHPSIGKANPAPQTQSITARTPSTATIDTLNPCTTCAITSTIVPLQRGLRHTTNTRAREIRLLGLHTPQTTQLLITLLLPLGNKVCVCVPVLQQPVVELLRDGLAFVVQVVDVARARVRDLEDRPQRLMLLLAFVRRVLCVPHLVAVLEECVFDVVEAGGRRFARVARADGWHFLGDGWMCFLVSVVENERI